MDTPFSKPGRFYKGNLHTHSTRSDGGLSPEAVCAFYRRMGFVDRAEIPRPYVSTTMTLVRGELSRP